MILDYIALGVIVFLMIGLTAVIVVIGSLPGNIARQRNHPWSDAVNIASWIGLLTGVLWPLALVWAYLPVPSPQNGPSVDGTEDEKKLRQRVAELEGTIAKTQKTGSEA
jgi:Protein of unknown function (DUF3302)